MSQRGLVGLVLLIAVLVISVGVGTYYLGIKTTKVNPSTQQTNQAVLTPSPQPSLPHPSSTADPTTNWQTYSNFKYGIFVKYPPNFNVKVEADTATQFRVSLASSTSGIDLSVIKAYNNINGTNVPNILFPPSSKITKQVTLGNTVWDVRAPSQYCDAGNCGTTIGGYETVKGVYRYDLASQQDIESNQTLNQIISTFKFTQ